MNITRYHIGKDLGETIQPQGDVIEHPSGWWCSAGEVEKEINRLTAALAEKEAECALLENTIEIQEGEIKCLVRERVILCKFKKDNYIRIEELEATIHELQGTNGMLREDRTRLAEQLRLANNDNFTTTAELEAAESLAASRLADQEAIERHVTKRVAGECAEIAGGCYYAKTMAEEIKERYGVE